MNIAFISGSLGFGGIERQLTEIAKYLSITNHQVIVYYFNEKIGFLSIIKQYADKVIQIPKPRKKSFTPFFFLYNSLKEESIDLIHTFDSMSTFYSIFTAKFRHIPIIDGSIRDSGIEKRIEYLFKRFNLLLAGNVIANSKAGLKYYKIKNGDVIYNALNQERFINTTCKDNNIIMVASFSDYKDHNTFLRASRRLIDESIINNVYLVGDGIHLSKYKNLVERWHLSDRITFLGSRSDIENILSRCLIGVLCSTIKFSEGISNSILEYMAAELIAIGSDLGAVPEIIEHGKNGFLYEPENVDSLVNVIKVAIEKRALWPEIIKNAKKTLITKFSFDGNMKRILSVYTKVINEEN